MSSPRLHERATFFEYRLVSSPDEEALEDDFGSLSMMSMEKELPDILVLGQQKWLLPWRCEQPSGHAAPESH